MSKPKPWVKYEKIDDRTGRFIAAPLKRGMGVTLGNSLRRVLLSSLSGYAVTSVKIDGVKHEFATIPNVVEDVLDILCNVKGLVFKSDSEEPIAMKIDVKGKKKVTAKDIVCSSEASIVNKDWHIAEVSDGGKLNMEMILEKGFGYSPSDANEKEGLDINTITIDSSFSPISRVNHNVQNIRVGKELDYDSLTLDVWTNGSVEPGIAVKQASSILVEKFGLFENLNEKPDEEEKELEDSAEVAGESALNLSVDDLELSARSSNCLKRAGIELVSELIEKDMQELIQIKNFGKKSADEINEKLKQYGLVLKDK